MAVTLDAFLAMALSAFGFVESVAVIIAGVLFGAVILWSMIPAGAAIHASFRYAGLITSLLGLAFFASRGAALYYDHSVLWPRNVGFALLWVVYCVSMGAGLALRRRLT
jgi:hypothetical protein